MRTSKVRALVLVLSLALATSAPARDVGSRVAEGSTSTDPDPEGSKVPDAAEPSKSPTAPAPTNLHEWLLRPFSEEADRDGPINTDRPTS